MKELDGVRQYVDVQLDNILKRPQMYGDQQAVEMQILTLLEVQNVSYGKDANVGLKAWRDFMTASKCGIMSLSGQGWSWDTFMIKMEAFVKSARHG